MRIRKIAWYAALIAGGAFAGNRTEHYQLTGQMEIERQNAQKVLSEAQDKLSTCQTELRRYEIRNIDKTWRLNPDLSVDVTGIDGTRTVEWRPEYQEVFRNQKR